MTHVQLHVKLRGMEAAQLPFDPFSHMDEPYRQAKRPFETVDLWFEHHLVVDNNLLFFGCIQPQGISMLLAFMDFSGIV